MNTNPQHVLCEELPTQNAKLGVITLNRPEALNSLSADMIVKLHQQLHAWATNPKIVAVLIKSSIPRAFCAGGDLKQMYDAGQKDYQQLLPFFTYEYQVNRLIHNYPKPYIALVNGITMGGGLGVSVHGSQIIASENLKMAMPETGIGFYPDVGASYFLGHCPHFLGMFLGLTGTIIDATDAIYCGLVQTFVPQTKFDELIQALCASDLSNATDRKISQVIHEFSATTASPSLAEHVDIIEECFSKKSVTEIMQALAANNSAWAQQQLAILNTKSPTSLKITHKQLTLGASKDINACMDMEYNLTQKLVQSHDLYEGIRATLIDKTRDPKWQPATLDAVSDVAIDKLFEIKCQL